MVRSVKQLQGNPLAATDGEIGAVRDFYFDDRWWTVRYLAVDTGKWLPGRVVLLSAAVIGHPDWSRQTIDVALTREEVKNSPDVDTHKPVSRQQELSNLRYYGVPPYWTGPELWGAARYPMRMTPADRAELDRAIERAQAEAAVQGDDHLRSTREVTGYQIDATDGDLGKVGDFLVDEDTWAIRYLVVNTSRWWFVKQVLIPPSWTTSVHWDKRAVSIKVTREHVQHAPPYDAAAHLDRQWESDYYRHYGMPPYWDDQTPHRAQ
jgi:uncharacterized protein YrrD